jgi:AcrR family transcriptional regulator
MNKQTNTSSKETENERLILQAAEAEFLEKGYGKSRTTEIAKRAGLTHAMLHYYFRTKENLLEVVFQKKAKLMSEIILFALKKELPFLEKIKKGIEDHFDLVALNSRMPNFIFSEVLHDKKIRGLFLDIIQKQAQELLKSLKHEIDAEAGKGTIRYIDASDLLYNIVSLNIFVFMGAPIICGVMGFEEKQFRKFLKYRKQKNVEIILNRLKV